jgi:hypothetical protein
MLYCRFFAALVQEGSRKQGLKLDGAHKLLAILMVNLVGENIKMSILKTNIHELLLVAGKEVARKC